MLKLSTQKIFIYGMRVIGVEIIKNINILLASPQKVNIFDVNKSTINEACFKELS